MRRNIKVKFSGKEINGKKLASVKINHATPAETVATAAVLFETAIKEMGCNEERRNACEVMSTVISHMKDMVEDDEVQ